MKRWVPWDDRARRGPKDKSRPDPELVYILVNYYKMYSTYSSYMINLTPQGVLLSRGGRRRSPFVGEFTSPIVDGWIAGRGIKGVDVDAMVEDDPWDIPQYLAQMRMGGWKESQTEGIFSEVDGRLRGHQNVIGDSEFSVAFIGRLSTTRVTDCLYLVQRDSRHLWTFKVKAGRTLGQKCSRNRRTRTKLRGI
jgi:hypothetical protein